MPSFVFFPFACICVYNKRLPWNDNEYKEKKKTKNVFGGSELNKRALNEEKNRVAIKKSNSSTFQYYSTSINLQSGLDVLTCIKIYWAIFFPNKIVRYTQHLSLKYPKSKEWEKRGLKDQKNKNSSNHCFMCLDPLAKRRTYTKFYTFLFYVTTRLRIEQRLKLKTQNIDPKKFFSFFLSEAGNIHNLCPLPACLLSLPHSRW